MENFTPIASSIGGALIGLASALLLFMQGRIAGISGIAGGVLSRMRGDLDWRIAFLAGLVTGGAVYALAAPSAFAVTVDRSTLALVVAGLLVGFGTRLGSGCTSGHGVCGVSRVSSRSLVATATFVATGTLVVLIINRVLGGSV